MSSRILAGRYELIEKVGEGGMAVVYKARDRLLNRFVAVKILKPEFTKDLKFIESFRRESQAAASLTHPNIVNVYDVGKEGNIHYIVMEYIEGKVLSDLIREEGALDPRRAVSVAKQIASALGLAHKNHIIHRDVKPHNILMTEEGVAKITDFGIAKAITNATIVGNQTGTIMGSVHYFSPEQARGGYVDEKSDIYSLGVVLYEMLTGKVPFDADNPVAVAVMHMNEEMIPPSQLVPEIPPDVEAIVMKATSKYQVNRYKSADEMLTALNLANYHPAARGMAPDMVAMGMPEEETALAVSQGQKMVAADNKKGDKENMGKDKKKKKFRINKVKMGAVVLALVCAVPLSGLIFAGIQTLTAPKTVTVPDLVGKTQEEAQAELEELKLVMEVDQLVSSDEFDEGQVVSQSPKANTEAKEGKVITVNVSKGEAQTSHSIPDITGLTETDAQYKLEKYGFILGSASEESSDRPKGIILSQKPEAGSEADKGTRVNYTMSSGEDTAEITMPNLVGFDVEKAKSEITKAGLKVGDTNSDYSSAYGKNKVIDQSVAAGEAVKRGTAIDLTVSKGPKGQVNSVAIEIPYDKAKFDIFNLSVMVTIGTETKQPISREPKYKEDSPGIITVDGSGKGTVQVWFDDDLVYKFSVNFDEQTYTAQ